MGISIEKAPKFRVAGWYVCDWSKDYETWVYSTKEEAVSFAESYAQQIGEHRHLNVSWLSPPVSGSLNTIEIMRQIYSRMESTKLHDRRVV